MSKWAGMLRWISERKMFHSHYGDCGRPENILALTNGTALFYDIDAVLPDRDSSNFLIRVSANAGNFHAPTPRVQTRKNVVVVFLVDIGNSAQQEASITAYLSHIAETMGSITGEVQRLAILNTDVYANARDKISRDLALLANSALTGVHRSRCLREAKASCNTRS
ncbi:hypothetical protein AJ78_02050 [Emergomyces pasteurianus Ep9510]|uniref:Uncharacterized protein n=1 Tax=Emergomyces pasteurianus Ep9510 TaxID=1447872 RepID=A0A1J9PNZ3_9EURO|nr:hypothetical protein AJ78_02050 [Emergomyces pasteurianus Ep9510]